MKKDADHQRQKCAFCEVTRLTSEHIWGSWMIRRAPPSAREKVPNPHLVRNSTSQPGSEYLTDVKAQRGIYKNIQSGIYTKRRLVCRKCNNTWMSKIDNQVVNVFEWLYQQNAGSPGLMHPDLCLRFSKWAALKSALLTYSLLIEHEGYNPLSENEKSTIPTFPK